MTGNWSFCKLLIILSIGCILWSRLSFAIDEIKSPDSTILRVQENLKHKITQFDDEGLNPSLEPNSKYLMALAVNQFTPKENESGELYFEDRAIKGCSATIIESNTQTPISTPLNFKNVFCREPGTLLSEVKTLKISQCQWNSVRKNKNSFSLFENLEKSEISMQNIQVEFNKNKEIRCRGDIYLDDMGWIPLEGPCAMTEEGTFAIKNSNTLDKKEYPLKAYFEFEGNSLKDKISNSKYKSLLNAIQSAQLIFVISIPLKNETSQLIRFLHSNKASKECDYHKPIKK